MPTLKIKKSRLPKPRPKLKNRYVKNAKQSEYKFLRILRGFAEAKTPYELNAECSISVRTIRDTYWELRDKMFEALQTDKRLFGGAGRFLYPHGKIEQQGILLLEAVSQSEAFAALVALQYPGNREPTDEQCGLLVLEMAVRFYCKSSSTRGKLEETPAAVMLLQSVILDRIKDIDAAELDPAQRWTVTPLKIEVEHKFAELKLLELQHALKAATSGHRLSIDPSHMIYGDMRKYLAKHPI